MGSNGGNPQQTSWFDNRRSIGSTSDGPSSGRSNRDSRTSRRQGRRSLLSDGGMSDATTLVAPSERQGHTRHLSTASSVPSASSDHERHLRRTSNVMGGMTYTALDPTRRPGTGSSQGQGGGDQGAGRVARRSQEGDSDPQRWGEEEEEEEGNERCEVRRHVKGMLQHNGHFLRTRSPIPSLLSVGLE